MLTYLKDSQHLIIYLLSFAVFLVLKDSSNPKSESKKSSNLKEKTMKGDSKVKKSTSKTSKKSLETNPHQEDNKHTAIQVIESIKSLRPEDEVVTYNEIDFELREIT